MSIISLVSINLKTYSYNISMDAGMKDSSSHLFNILINDLSKYINNERCGIKANIYYISVTLYAYGFYTYWIMWVQTLLKCLDRWCFKCRISVYVNNAIIVMLLFKKTTIHYQYN